MLTIQRIPAEAQLSYTAFIIGRGPQQKTVSKFFASKPEVTTPPEPFAPPSFIIRGITASSAKKVKRCVTSPSRSLSSGPEIQPRLNPAKKSAWIVFARNASGAMPAPPATSAVRFSSARKKGLKPFPKGPISSAVSPSRKAQIASVPFPRWSTTNEISPFL
jgi:hypothetical protein